MAKQNRNKNTSAAAPVAAVVAPVLALQSAATEQPEAQTETHTAAAVIVGTVAAPAPRQTVAVSLVRVAESEEDVDGHLYDPRGRHATLAESLASGELAPDAIVSEGAVALTLRSVEASGIVTAVTLAPSQTGTGFVLVDGRQRFQIARHLQHEAIPATVIPYPASRAEGLRLIMASAVTVKTDKAQDAAGAVALYESLIAPSVGLNTEAARKEVARVAGMNEAYVAAIIKLWPSTADCPDLSRLARSGALPASAYVRLSTVATDKNQGTARVNAIALCILHHLENGLTIDPIGQNIIENRKVNVKGLRILTECFAGELTGAELAAEHRRAVAEWATKTARNAEGAKVWPQGKQLPPAAPAVKPATDKKTDENKAADKGNDQTPPEGSTTEQQSSAAPATEGSTPPVVTVVDPAAAQGTSPKPAANPEPARRDAAGIDKSQQVDVVPITEEKVNEIRAYIVNEIVRTQDLAQKATLQEIVAAINWLTGYQYSPKATIGKILAAADAESRARRDAAAKARAEADRRALVIT
jgi:hypothetical protein